MAENEVSRRVRLSSDLSSLLDQEAMQTGRSTSDVIRDAIDAYLHHQTELRASDTITIQRQEEMLIAIQKGFRSMDTHFQTINDKLDLNAQLYRNPNYLGDEDVNS